MRHRCDHLGKDLHDLLLRRPGTSGGTSVYGTSVGGAPPSPAHEPARAHGRRGDAALQVKSTPSHPQYTNASASPMPSGVQ